MTRIAALLVLLATPAFAGTPCPQVSNGASILSVNIVSAPQPVAYAGYDLETAYLTVTFTSQTSQMFIGVPRRMVKGAQIQWANISGYPPAVMQEKSTCPLLTENNLPIWSQ